MRVLKEWYGLFNSSLYLQEITIDDNTFLLLSYCHSLIGGNRYEGGETYAISLLEDDTSDLVQLIKSDFGVSVLSDIKKNVAGYINNIATNGI